MGFYDESQWITASVRLLGSQKEKPVQNSFLKPRHIPGRNRYLLQGEGADSRRSVPFHGDSGRASWAAR